MDSCECSQTKGARLLNAAHAPGARNQITNAQAAKSRNAKTRRQGSKNIPKRLYDMIASVVLEGGRALCQQNNNNNNN